MSTKRILKTLAVMAVMLSVAALPAMAQSELDQSQTTVDTWRQLSDPLRQTFTAQKTCTLDGVSIYTACYEFTPCNIDPSNPLLPGVDMWVKGPGVDRFLPGAPVPSGEGWTSYFFAGNQPVVEAGKQYELLISPSLPFLGGASSDVYPGGEFSWQDPDGIWHTQDDFKDAAFQTYVTPDTTAPKVDSVSPADGTKDVKRSSSVTAYFSERVQDATLTSDTVQLLAGKSTRPIKASLKWDPFTNPTSVTLTPSSKLDAKTRYTAKIKGGSTGVKDLVGNPLASDYTWSFTTGSM